MKYYQSKEYHIILEEIHDLVNALCDDALPIMSRISCEEDIGKLIKKILRNRKRENSLNIKSI